MKPYHVLNFLAFEALCSYMVCSYLKKRVHYNGIQRISRTAMHCNAIKNIQRNKLQYNKAQHLTMATFILLKENGRI